MGPVIVKLLNSSAPQWFMFFALLRTNEGFQPEDKRKRLLCLDYGPVNRTIHIVIYTFLVFVILNTV